MEPENIASIPTEAPDKVEPAQQAEGIDTAASAEATAVAEASADADANTDNAASTDSIDAPVDKNGPPQADPVVAAQAVAAEGEPQQPTAQQ